MGRNGPEPGFSIGAVTSLAAQSVAHKPPVAKSSRKRIVLLSTAKSFQFQDDFLRKCHVIRAILVTAPRSIESFETADPVRVDDEEAPPILLLEPGLGLHVDGGGTDAMEHQDQGKGT
jgi:hypothetical protein